MSRGQWGARVVGRLYHSGRGGLHSAGDDRGGCACLADLRLSGGGHRCGQGASD